MMPTRRSPLLHGALASGTVRLAEVILLGTAIAGAASLVLAFGANIGAQLASAPPDMRCGPRQRSLPAGFAAVGFYACRLGVPRAALLSTAALGAMAVVIGQGLPPADQPADPEPTHAHRCVGHRSRRPATRPPVARSGSALDGCRNPASAARTGHPAATA